MKGWQLKANIQIFSLINKKMTRSQNISSDKYGGISRTLNIQNMFL